MMFTRGHLMKWRSRALRRGVLFSALDAEDRGYLYLAIKVLDRVRSVEVGRIIVKLLVKLREALKSPFVRRVETYGVERARVVSSWAVEWGYKTARSWARDRGLARYLTVLDFYAPSGWGV